MPVFVVHGLASVALAQEEILKLPRCRRVIYQGVYLVVAPQRTAVKVRRPDITPLSVNSHYLGMMEAALIIINFCSGFGKSAGLIVHDSGSYRNVALFGNHNLYVNAPLYCIFYGTDNGMVQCKIRIDQPYFFF